MINLIDLMVNREASRYTLNTPGVAIFLGEVDAIGSHGRIVLGLCFHLHTFNHLVV